MFLDDGQFLLSYEDQTILWYTLATNSLILLAFLIIPTHLAVEENYKTEDIFISAIGYYFLGALMMAFAYLAGPLTSVGILIYIIWYILKYRFWEDIKLPKKKLSAKEKYKKNLLNNFKY